MSRLSFVMVLLSFMLVKSDDQCSCSDLKFIEQFLLQEMFERKLEISNLRSEIQTTSTLPVLIDTDSVKDTDIIKRVEQLERRFNELENANNDTDENDAIVISTQDEMDFQSIVRNTLKREKIERVDFNANVQNHLEQVNDTMSTFMNTTTGHMEEQVNEWSSNFNLFKNDTWKAFLNFKETVTNITHYMNDKIQKNEAVIKEIRGQLDKLIGTCDVYGDYWILLGLKCYRFIDEEKDWTSAKLECIRLSGKLLKIENKEENDFIKKSFPKRKEVYWIGLYEPNRENQWRWISSTEDLCSGNFTNWAPGEPNDWGSGNEDCAYIMESGQWNDFSCSAKQPFICEANPQ